MPLPFKLDSAIDGLAKVTLRGGVVGKITFSVTLVSIVIGLIAWSIHNIWVSTAALCMVFVLSFTMLWRLINFADRNPQAALLEGAEFLMHQQIIHASKEAPYLPHPQTIQTQPDPIEGPAADPRLAAIPDELPPNTQNLGGPN